MLNNLLMFVIGFITSLCNATFWIGVVIANQLGPILINSILRVSGTLLIFSGNIVLLFLIVLLAMPETKVNLDLAVLVCVDIIVVVFL